MKITDTEVEVSREWLPQSFYARRVSKGVMAISTKYSSNHNKFTFIL